MSQTVTVTWAHHYEWDGKPVLPGDAVEMLPDVARGYAAAGMLTIDPEDAVAMATIAAAVPAQQGLAATSTLYDPTAHTVAEVNAYLAVSTEAERDRVLAIEAASASPRSSINGLA